MITSKVNTVLYKRCYIALAVVLFGTGFAHAEPIYMTFRTGVFPNSKSLDACSRDAMAALSDSGFTQNLQFLKGQPPSIAVSGAGSNGLGMIVCAQNHDVVLTLSSVKSGSETEANMTALATKLNQITSTH